MDVKDDTAIVEIWICYISLVFMKKYFYFMNLDTRILLLVLHLINMLDLIDFKHYFYDNIFLKIKICDMFDHS